MVETVLYNDPHEIVNDLLLHSSIPHDDYESVKLYGDSEFILDILKCVIQHFPEILIASIDITLNEVDPVEKDLYVLSLTDNKELYIQSGWNGTQLYRNEAKCVLCQKHKYSSIVNILDEDITIKLF